MKFSEIPTYNINKNSRAVKLLKSCQPFIMERMHCGAQRKKIDVLHRTLIDLRENEWLFSGVLILLSRDIRQTIPVIPFSMPTDDNMYRN